MEITTSLFDGVTKDEYDAMMVCFKAVVKTYKKGEEITVGHDRVGVVQKGKASLLKTDLNGVRTIFEQLRPGRESTKLGYDDFYYSYLSIGLSVFY